MKTLIKLLAVVPLLWLGGCYTQIAVRNTGYGNGGYTNGDGQYSQNDLNQDSTGYYNQDSTGYYDQNNYDYNYYNDGSYSGYRRFLWGYYPSYGFNLGYYYDPFGYDGYGYSPYYYWGQGYYWSNYYYPNSLWGYYNNYWGNYMPYTNYKYRSYTALRPRGNEGDRGSATRYRNSGGGGRSSAAGVGYPTRDRNANTGLNVDLNNVRVSREANPGNNSGSRLSKETPRNNTSSRNAEVRSRNRNERQDPQVRDNPNRRSGESGRATRGESSRPSYSPPPRSERPAPSYTPRSEPSSQPAPSEAPRSESSGRSGSGSRESSGRGR